MSEQNINEAIKIGAKVKIHAPGKDYHDQSGHVGEVRHGSYKGAPKTYTVDYGDRKSVQLDKKNIKLHNEDIKLDEDLTNKTIRPTDKVKVARVIANMLDVENVESMSPEVAINQGLRKIRHKRMTPELLTVLRKMLNLAQMVGVKVNMDLLPHSMKQDSIAEVVQSSAWPNKGENETDILRLKDYIALDKAQHGQHTKVGHSIHPTVAGKDTKDHIRCMKVKYKTEDVEASADYKTDKRVRKHSAREIVFHNGEDDNNSADKKDVKEQAVGYDTAAHKENMLDATKKASMILKHARERESMASRHDQQKKAVTEEADGLDDADVEVLDLSDDDVDNFVTYDNLLDILDDDEIHYVDMDTGEVVEDDEDVVNEQALQEVLSRTERMKAKVRFMRTKSKRERRISIALKKRSDSKTINKRARRLAIKLIKQKLVKKPLAKMSVSEKERVERMIQQRKALIDRLAMRMAPKVRRMEADRLGGHKSAAPKVGV